LAEIQIDLDFAGVGEQKWTIKKAAEAVQTGSGPVLSQKALS